jgi:nicotinamide-nucleotide amidase
MRLPEDIAQLARETGAALTAKGITVATAESCTGGLLAGALTAIPGASDTFYGGFVTYANEAKIAMVGVPYALLREFGAVSKEVATAMAEGAMAAAGTHLGVSVTGIAGPDGGSKEKPIGLVFFAVSTTDGTRNLKKTFDPAWSRDEIRHASVIEALKLIKKAAGA